MRQKVKQTKLTKPINYTELWFHRKTGQLLHRWCSSKSKVLEIGIGEGDYLYLYPFSIDLTLGDIKISPRLKERVGNWAKTRPLNVHQLPFSQETFEVVIMHSTIAHLENPAKAIKEIARVLKPKGKFILSTTIKGPLGLGLHKNKKGERVLEEGHINEFKTQEALIRLLEKNKRLKVMDTEKRPVYFPFKKFLPQKLVKKLIFLFDRLRLPMYFYYYNHFLVLEKK